MRQQEELAEQNVPYAVAEAGISGPVSPLALDLEEAVLEAEVVPSSWLVAWRRFRRNWAAVVSLGVILALIFMALFAPFLHSMNPLTQNYLQLDRPPSAQHWFGTDGLGRDLYSRLLYGLRVPLLVGLTGAFITVIVGTLLGVIAGYHGGFVDSLLARFTDLMFAFPGFTLALIVMSMYGNALDPYFAGAGRMMVLTIVFAIVGWPGLMRFVRSLVLSLRDSQFIEAARVAGTTDRKIITRHLLPNMWGLILVQASFVVVGFVYTEAVLSIFGIGVEAPNPDLGQMLFDGSSRLNLNASEALIPAAFLTLIILSFTFCGDGIRDATDAKMDQ